MKEIKQKHTPHVMTGKVCHWRYCKNCGLVELKNDVTRQRLRQRCEG